MATPLPPEFAPGLSYTNYLVPEVPWSIHVLRVKRSNPELELKSTHASGGALGLSTLSTQVRSLKPELGTPVAAINGDFYTRDRAYAGHPRGLQIIESELISAPSGGVSFWIGADGLPHAANVLSGLKVTWPDGASAPFGLNEERRTNTEIVLYTPALGRSTHTAGGLELVLEKSGEGPWLPLRIGASYTARVREARQSGDSPLSPETMVLSIGSALRQTLPALEAGAVLKLSTGSAPDLAGAKTAISGGPLLAKGGRRQSWQTEVPLGQSAYEVRSMSERHPRTALGWDNQYYYLVEVDGRQAKLSVGMTLKELADFMIGMGCQEVINFDGGGSSMEWCNGRIVNSPCDRREREVANALMVVRKPGGPGGATTHVQPAAQRPL